MKRLLIVVPALFVVACAAETLPPEGPTEAELLPSEAYHPGTGLVWLRCPVGMTWDGADCAGTPADLAFDAAIVGCTDVRPDYRLPTLRELGLLLGSCSEETVEARCLPCAESADCSATLSAQEISDWTWTSDRTGDYAFVVEVSQGRIAYEDPATVDVQTRCVRPR
jgi:hypothetical protein